MIVSWPEKPEKPAPGHGPDGADPLAGGADQGRRRAVTVRLGGGQGFYGDGHAPVDDLLEAGVDYLVCEALAELTLAILQKDRQRDESLGYTRDLPLYLQQAIPWILDGRTRLITNAGGINPVAAGRAVMQAAGVSNILTKSIGTSNPHNVIKATFEGLRSLKDPQEVARLREKPLEEILG